MPPITRSVQDEERGASGRVGGSFVVLFARIIYIIIMSSLSDTSGGGCNTGAQGWRRRILESPGLVRVRPSASVSLQEEDGFRVRVLRRYISIELARLIIVIIILPSLPGDDVGAG